MATVHSGPYQAIASAFIEGTKAPKNNRLYAARFEQDPGYIGGVNTQKLGTPRALFSYGPHFPVLIEADECNSAAYWLNESDYKPSETDRQLSPFSASPY